MSDERLLKQKYPSMYPEQEKEPDSGKTEQEILDEKYPEDKKAREKEQARLKMKYPSMHGKPEVTPLKYQGMTGQARARKDYIEERIDQFDEDSSDSKLPPEVIVGLHEKMLRQMHRVVSSMEINNNPEFTYKAMLGQLNLRFGGDSQTAIRRAAKYPSMGSIDEQIESWLVEDVRPGEEIEREAQEAKEAEIEVVEG